MPTRSPKFLDHKTYGFSDADLDREFYMGEAAIGAYACRSSLG